MAKQITFKIILLIISISISYKGALFQHIKDELLEKNLAIRLWDLFEEMLKLIIDVVAQNGIIEIKL